MALAKRANAPLNFPNMPDGGRFDWEAEETLVDRRRKLGPRISRLIRRWWLPLTIIGIIVLALYNGAVMIALINAIFGFMDFIGTMSSPPNFGNSRILSFVTQVLTILIIVLTFLFQFVVFFWIGSRSRMYTIWPGQEGVSFKDYRGQPELIEQARQIVMLLRGVRAFEESGGEPLNGLLLEGPPGTGKTWLAQAISTEAGVPFFFVDASTLQGTFVGMGAIKISRLYGKARRAARDWGAAVVFMDEIDTIGSRGGVSRVGVGAGDEPDDDDGGMNSFAAMQGLLSTMLIEMSGFSLEHGWRARLRTWWYRKIMRRQPPPPQKRVLTIGATNRISALDPALLRPGRFDKKLRVDAPDLEGRVDILTYYLSKIAHDDTVEPVTLAAQTPGYTPADLKYLLNEALRYAFFDGRRYMTYHDFLLAQPEHEMGLRSPVKRMSKEAKERIAVHEAGHAVAVRLFMKHHRIARITIIRQGAAYGHVSHYPARESYLGLRTKDEWINRLRVSVAGKAGEVEFMGMKSQTLGVGGDFINIRNILFQMAMAGLLGPLGAVARERRTFGYRQYELTHELEEAMEGMFQDVFTETRQALRDNAPMMRALVARLLMQEEMLAEEVEAFFRDYGLETPRLSIVRDGEEVFIERPTPVLPQTAAGD